MLANRFKLIQPAYCRRQTMVVVTLCVCRTLWWWLTKLHCLGKAAEIGSNFVMGFG